MNIEDIDIERLRRDLLDYFGTAMTVVSPIAMMDVERVENASDEELIRIALNNGVDLSGYIKHEKGLYL